MWPDFEATLKRYDELKSNDSVLNALRAYNANAQAHLKIGPSDNLSKEAKQVIAYERTYSPETAPQIKKMPRPKRLDLKKKRDKQVLSQTKDAMPSQ